MENRFNEDDKKKFIEFLNFVAVHAKFNVSTDDVIKYFKLLSHMQQVMLPKVDANILEIKKIINPPKEENK